jgi:hypothetical protein
MLSLKHHIIVKDFMDIYDTIVGGVMNVEFNSIRRPNDRFNVIKAISKMLEKGVERINDYFMNTYDMKDDSVEIMKFL